MDKVVKILIIVATVLVVVAGLLYVLRRHAATKANATPEFSEEEYNHHYEAKKAALERVLGPMHDTVGHAVIPFQVGGAVDMYYFPNGISGTGFVTMELIEPDGSGAKPNRVGTYELVAFTKHPLPPAENKPAPEDKPDGHPYHRIERRLCGIFTMTGFYSQKRALNPGDTSEIPGDEGEPSTCLLFDQYAPEGIPFEIAGRKHCLLLCMEIFRSEMEHAMEHGSDTLIQKLKVAGHYPYSDLDRDPVY